MSEDDRIRWQGEVPVSTEFDDVYFSARDGLSEARYVFLGGNELPQRWEFRDWSRSPRFTVGELGFGTGLNLLALWQAWRAFRSGFTGPEKPILHFISCERTLLSEADVRRALHVWRDRGDEGLADALIDEYLSAYPRLAVPSLVPVFRRMLFEDGSLVVTLLHGEALDAYSGLDSAPVDAWFLDGFSPKKNPEMWRPELLKELARLSGPETTFATFSSAGQLRRDLEAAGFLPRKRPGFAGKREMLHGTFGGAAEGRSARRPPWFQLTGPHERADAVVIGAGLAGTSAALALADRGFQVTVIERAEAAGRGASGNSAAAIAPVLSSVPDRVSRFALTAFARFLGHYHRLRREERAFEGELCGLIQLASADDARAQLEGLQSHGISPAWVRALSREEASEVAGVEVASGGLLFREAGWVRPADVCRANLEAAGSRVRLVTSTEALALRRESGQWQVTGAGGVIASAPIAIVATGTDAAAFEQTAFLPVRILRGQLDYFPRNERFSALRTVLSYGGGVIPSDPVVIGATFEQRSRETAFDQDSARELVERLERNVPGLQGAAELSREIQGRVAFRAVSPDAFPIVGPVPDRDYYLEAYERLRFGDRRVEYAPARYQPGLWVTTAHGSRGLIYSHLAAEILAAEMTGEPAPHERELVEVVHPARFLVRDLIRRKA